MPAVARGGAAATVVTSSTAPISAAFIYMRRSAIRDSEVVSYKS
jgi:hypothetical protein